MTLGPRPYYWPNTKTLSFGNSPPIATRTGWMALGCLPFVIATSSKSNMITAFTGISHEKLQVFHRWISYAMFVLGLIHTFPFIVFHFWKGDMITVWSTSVVYWTGVVTLIAQAWLTFASMSPLRYVNNCKDCSWPGLTNSETGTTSSSSSPTFLPPSSLSCSSSSTATSVSPHGTTSSPPQSSSPLPSSTRSSASSSSTASASVPTYTSSRTASSVSVSPLQAPGAQVSTTSSASSCLVSASTP